MKYNINFNFRLINLYNLKILVTNTIKLKLFRNFEIAIVLSCHLGSIAGPVMLDLSHDSSL